MSVEYRHWILPTSRDYRPTATLLARLVEELRRERWIRPSGGTAQRFGKNPIAPKKALRERDKLREEIPTPLTAAWIEERLDARHSNPLARELALYFPVRLLGGDDDESLDEDVLYPFTFGEDDDGNSHHVEIYLADDFVNYSDNGMGRIETPTCASCGTALGYESDTDVEHVDAIDGPWFEGRITRSCPKCATVFDPLEGSGYVVDGWDHSNPPVLTQRAGAVAFRFAVSINPDVGWPRDQGRLALKPEFFALVEKVLGEPMVEFGGLS